MRRVCTTFHVKTESLGKADSEVVQQRLLLSSWLGDAPQTDLTTIGGGQDDVGTLKPGQQV